MYWSLGLIAATRGPPPPPPPPPIVPSSPSPPSPPVGSGCGVRTVLEPSPHFDVLGFGCPLDSVLRSSCLDMHSLCLGPASSGVFGV